MSRSIRTSGCHTPPRTTRALRVAATGVVLAALLAGCASSPGGTGPAEPPTSISAYTPTLATEPPSAAASSISPAITTPVATSSRPAPAHSTTKPAPATGGYRLYDGALLPNAARTPGATNPAVTQGDISSTICRSGWTATIRPPESYTTALKERQLASGYSWHGDLSTSDYEEDHLISLELGGSPSAPANLWPEPYNAPDGARVKDRIENKLRALVCDGAMTLAGAQHAIATNWYAAYLTYVGTPAPAPQPVTTHRSSTPPPPPPAPAPAGGVPAGATARCNDGTYSFAQHHQGACSHHGGVAVWYR